jgi:hypothetical protein
MPQKIREIWSASKLYRVLLVAAVVYAVLRLVLQGAYLAMMLLPELGLMGGVPDWVGAEGPMIPDDLRIYLDAAADLVQRENVYLQGPVDRMEFYQYSPSFALLMTVFLWLPRSVSAILHTGLHIVAYVFLYVKWAQLLRRWNLPKARHYLAWALPVWLIFSLFWADLGYLNVYIMMALLSTWLTEAVIDENLAHAVLWTVLIGLIKPQWAFALVVPLLLGRWRFFIKLVAFSGAIYIAVSGLTVWAVGVDYGWRQQMDYIRILRGISSNVYPWRVPSDPFLGYNHAIKQILVYALGAKPSVFALATVVKIVILLPLGGISLRYLRNALHRTERYEPRLGLDLAFAFYLGAFIWLDMVWELSLGIAIFPYLLGTVGQRSTRIWLNVVFLPYALLDVWQAVSFVFGGMDVVLPGAYIVTDPSIYVPIIMFVILTFYVILILRLNRTARHLTEATERL